MVRILTLLAAGAMLTATPAVGQSAETEAEVIAAAVRYLQEVRSPRPGYSPQDQFVLDVGIEVRRLENGKRDRARAERVARLAGIRVVQLDEVLECPAPHEMESCRLRVGRVMRFGVPEIGANEARVEVLEWFSTPGLHDAAPMAFSEVFLQRTADGWRVSERKLIWRS